MNNDDKNDLILLGAWDETPLIAWPWFSDEGRKDFKQSFGYEYKVFSYFNDGLHYQYFFKFSTNPLYDKLESYSPEEKVEFIKRLCAYYFEKAQEVKNFIVKLEATEIFDLKEDELAVLVDQWLKVFSPVTNPIWTIVMLDIWYPGKDHEIEIKKIGAQARDHDGHLHEEIKRAVRTIFTEIAKRYRVERLDIERLAPYELKALLGGQRDILERSKHRADLFVTTNLADEYMLHHGQEARDLLATHIPPEEEEALSELIGMPACKGKVKGMARVIRLENEFMDFQEGEILVAPQTQVHYEHLMKKAAAILTEHGGLTSHAAVVSRELNVPCVVSIKGLISNVKTGDMLEVDAEKGIIKKL